MDTIIDVNEGGMTVERGSAFVATNRFSNAFQTIRPLLGDGRHAFLGDEHMPEDVAAALRRAGIIETQPAPCGCWLNDSGSGHFDACTEGA